MVLNNWSVRQNNNPFLAPELKQPQFHGQVIGHHNFLNGDFVITSPIQRFDLETAEFVTLSGSRYRLGSVDPKYLELYPDALERLIASLTARLAPAVQPERSPDMDRGGRGKRKKVAA